MSFVPVAYREVTIRVLSPSVSITSLSVPPTVYVGQEVSLTVKISISLPSGYTPAGRVIDTYRNVTVPLTISGNTATAKLKAPDKPGTWKLRVEVGYIAPRVKPPPPKPRPPPPKPKPPVIRPPAGYSFIITPQGCFDSSGRSVPLATALKGPTYVKAGRYKWGSVSAGSLTAERGTKVVNSTLNLLNGSKLYGLDFENSAVKAVNASGISVSNCYFKGAGDGMYCYNVKGVKVTNCTFEDCPHSGFYVTGPASDVEVSNCKFINCSVKHHWYVAMCEFFARGEIGNVRVENCEFYADKPTSQQVSMVLLSAESGYYLHDAVIKNCKFTVVDGESGKGFATAIYVHGWPYADHRKPHGYSPKRGVKTAYNIRIEGNVINSRGKLYRGITVVYARNVVWDRNRISGRIIQAPFYAGGSIAVRGTGNSPRKGILAHCEYCYIH